MAGVINQRSDVFALNAFANSFRMREVTLQLPEAWARQLVQIDINGTDQVGAFYRRHMVEWTFKTMVRVGLPLEIFFLTIRILDRVLALMHVKRKSMHTTMMAIIQIAIKMESDVWSREQMRAIANAMAVRLEDAATEELRILFRLKYKVRLTTPYDWVEGYYIIAAWPESVDTPPRWCVASDFLLALCGVDVHLSELLPSMLAAAVIYMVRSAEDMAPLWPANFARWSGYEVHEFAGAVRDIANLLKAENLRRPRSRICTRYASSAWYNVAPIYLDAYAQD